MASKKGKTVFACRECGAAAAKWLGRCPTCGSWSSLVEQKVHTPSASVSSAPSVAMRIGEVRAQEDFRWPSGIAELDRVLGGGVVAGGAVLVGGEPGIGKSTLLLQMLARVAAKGIETLYISGEESAEQIAQRAQRLGIDGSDRVALLSTGSLQNAMEALDKSEPQLLVIDSVQTLRSDSLESAAGVVSQLREVTARIVELAKQRNFAVFLVGHVTKEGQLAGPKLLEHLVDTVLSFEADSTHTLRLVRATKNRFGSTDETAVFEMSNEGLLEIKDPSALYLGQRAEQSVGSVIVPAMAGNRALLVEVQALVASATYGTARRVVDGMDANRLAILLAVLERRSAIQVLDQDVFVSVTGGLRLNETASDLAVSLAVVSSLRDRAVCPRMAAIGEVALTGQVRAVPRLAQRISECERHGFDSLIVPEINLSSLNQEFKQVRLIGVSTIQQALQHAFE